MTLNGGGEAAPERSLWEEAVMAASLFAVDPVGLGGIVVRSKYGPVRDQWVEFLRSILPDHVPFRKLPLYAADERLFGGLDLAGTLAHGKPIAERGLLADMDGGYLIVPSCERMEPALASRLGLVMDAGAVHVEREAASVTHPARFGVIALDESEGADEAPPVALLERLGLRIDLSELGYRDVTLAATSEDDIAAARTLLARVEVPDKIVTGLCAAASAFGVDFVARADLRGSRRPRRRGARRANRGGRRRRSPCRPVRARAPRNHDACAPAGARAAGRGEEGREGQGSGERGAEGRGGRQAADRHDHRRRRGRHPEAHPLEPVRQARQGSGECARRKKRERTVECDARTPRRRAPRRAASRLSHEPDRNVARRRALAEDPAASSPTLTTEAKRTAPFEPCRRSRFAATISG